MDELARNSMIGPFIIDQALARGEGGMAVIYQAHTRQDHRPIVVKVAREGASNLDAIRSEAETLRHLRHLNIVRILPIPLHTSSAKEYYLARAIDLPQQPWYMAIEMLQGGTLRKRLAEKKFLPVQEAVEWAIQIGRAVQYMAQQDIVHLDLKPENVMFRRHLSERPQEAVLIDFGIAKRLNQKTQKAGSLPYIAPERLRHAEGADVHIDSRADLYSLGVLLYEMLCGVVPFDGDDARTITEAIRSKKAARPSERNPSAHIPPEVEDIVMRTLNKLPGERIALGEFVSGLERAVPTRVIQEKKPVVFPPKLKFAIQLVIIVAAAIAVGFIGAMILQQVLLPQLGLPVR
jgi:serine/threonine protein kinase